MTVLQAATTKDAVEYVQDNLDRLGKVVFIEHTRNSNKIDYKTVISGERKKLIIEGGLTSGYTGGGPNGLMQVLKLLNVDESKANSLVYENTDNVYSFKHEF